MMMMMANNKKNVVGIYGEAELDGAEGDDEGAEDDGDGGVAEGDHGGGGAELVHHARLARAHLVPAPRVEERLPQLPPLLAALLSKAHGCLPLCLCASVSLCLPPTLSLSLSLTHHRTPPSKINHHRTPQPKKQRSLGCLLPRTAGDTYPRSK